MLECWHNIKDVHHPSGVSWWSTMASEWFSWF